MNVRQRADGLKVRLMLSPVSASVRRIMLERLEQSVVAHERSWHSVNRYIDTIDAMERWIGATIESAVAFTAAVNGEGNEQVITQGDAGQSDH